MGSHVRNWSAVRDVAKLLLHSACYSKVLLESRRFIFFRWRFISDFLHALVLTIRVELTT
jgi:hypothetical protein